MPELNEKTMEINLTNWLRGLCAILLIVILVFQFKQQGRLDALQRQQESLSSAVNLQQQQQRDLVAGLANQVTNLGVSFESRLAHNEQQAKENAAEIANAVQQQTAVVHRALGKVIPVELPDSLNKKLGALEARIADEKSWPKDVTEADAMLAELRNLVRQIPSWAEEDMLPRLNALRWGMSGLALIARSQTMPNNELADFFDSMDTALEAKPNGASELVANHLAAVQGKIKVQFDSFRRDTAIADAERLIKDGGTAADFSEIQERLSEWATVPEFKERIGRMQHDVKARALSDDTGNFISSVNKSLMRVRSEPSVVVRQISLGKLLDSVVSQRQMLAENQDAPASLDRKLAEISAQIEKAIEIEAKAQTDEQEKKLRDYQKWALASIQSFNNAFESANSRTKPMFSGDVKKGAKIGAAVGGIVVGVVKNPLDWVLETAVQVNPNVSDPDYNRVKQAMMDHLLPISVGLLDPAVARLYNEAFEKGWKQLDGAKQKHLQTEVAKQEAIVEKRKP